MGGFLSDLTWKGKTPDHIPPANCQIGFDPQLGFKAPRKPRVSRLSEQEMKALQIEPQLRNYCAHHIRDIMVCLKQYKPFHGLCNPERAAHRHCLIDDVVLRMKEYEREKRLRIRELRKQGKTIE